MMKQILATVAILALLVVGCATRQPTATAKLTMLGFSPEKAKSVDTYIQSESFTQDVLKTAGIADRAGVSVSAQVVESAASRSLTLEAQAASPEEALKLTQAIADTLEAKYSPGRRGLYPKFDIVQKPKLK